MDLTNPPLTGVATTRPHCLVTLRYLPRIVGSLRIPVLCRDSKLLIYGLFQRELYRLVDKTSARSRNNGSTLLPCKRNGIHRVRSGAQE